MVTGGLPIIAYVMSGFVVAAVVHYGGFHNKRIVSIILFNTCELHVRYEYGNLVKCHGRYNERPVQCTINGEEKYV